MVRCTHVHVQCTYQNDVISLLVAADIVVPYISSTFLPPILYGQDSNHEMLNTFSKLV